jgi:Outer membrane protein beta-barrel domain
MKKLIFTLALLSGPVFLFAQGVGVGIKAGANFCDYSTEDNVSTSSLTKYHVGAYANINFSEKWGITPEVLWSSQGAKIKNVGDFETDFVTVPIMLRWNPIDLIFIEAGPQFNFLTNAKLEGYPNIEDELKSSTTSAAFGAGVKLPLGFNGGLRYVVGLTDLSDNANAEFKEGTFQIYIGWTLLGSK